jgi:hypothetical protein
MDLRVLDEALAVCRLSPDSLWPVPAGDGFYSVTRTNVELSIVCSESQAPVDRSARVETGWRALEVVGPLEFSMVGVLADLSGLLAAAEVSLFVISTYDTDYILVRSDSLEKAIGVLREGGHHVSHH